MASNIVAYAGIDNFDNILYLSRILLKLGKKVLIVDHSDTRSLTFSIPQPKGICCEKELVTYRQVDFTIMTVDQEITFEYDDILIAYGFKEPMQDITICNRLVYVTDLYRYNHERKFSLPLNNILMDSNRALLVKDALEMKITPDIVADKINIRFQQENISVLYPNEKDYLNGLICHYNGIFRFTNISSQRKRYLLEEARRLHPEIEFKRIRVAYRQARRGE